MIEGGCNCGAIRYRAQGAPVVVAQCHCSNCRKQSGSAFSVNLLFKKDVVSHDGDLTVYEDTDTLSGNPVLRKFCGRCGSPIFSETTDGRGMLVVKAGTLDDPAPFAPTVSIWTATALPWVILPEGQYKIEKNA
ncbi:MAG: GFA family protein [Sphingopyxis sp.]|nr:GFA family protein [Sphingopyxis sp.]